MLWLNLKCLPQTHVFKQLVLDSTVLGSCRTLRGKTEMEKVGHWKVGQRSQILTWPWFQPKLSTSVQLSLQCKQLAHASASTVISHSAAITP